MTEREQRAAARQFSSDWKGRGYEKGESQIFWMSLLSKVYGIAEPDKYLRFEEKVKLDHASFIDVMIPSTHVMIEQKSFGKDLMAKARQSDGTYLTPVQQAKRYSLEIRYSERPRWIVICNFEEFHIYDMDNPNEKPNIVVRLENLEHDYYLLNFLVEDKVALLRREKEVSLAAGDLV
ncbi:MAG: methylase, partial [Muribaculaceae bacterium]|nr:methylase [Muribaculaceae bacterium]